MYNDLDGAVTNVPGVAAQTMSASYEPPTIRNTEVQVVPDWANASFAGTLSTLWWILQLLQVGGDVNDLVVGPAKNMKLDALGQVTAEATVVLNPPIGTTQANQAVAIERLGATRGADLSHWKVNNTRIYDKNGREIQTTIIADSWKVEPGVVDLSRRHLRQRPPGHVLRQHRQTGERQRGLGFAARTDLAVILSFDEKFPQELNSAIATITGIRPT